MLGAIVGDIVGSVHEGAGTKTKDFPLFVSGSTYTDDTVLTVAVAEWLLTGRDLADLFHEYYDAYPFCGYGGLFHDWAANRRRTAYNSFGNGSAMRAGPVGFAFDTIEEVLAWSGRSAAVTHDHPDGVRGAQAIAAAVHYARRIKDKDALQNMLQVQFGYDLGTPLDQIRPTYDLDVTCAGSIPQALRAFLESTSYEDAIRNAISLGGDADTLACMAGGVAEAYYGAVPEDIAAKALDLLDARLIDVIDRFRTRFGPS
jgi:ADP-ribosylglycohydrolase